MYKIALFISIISLLTACTSSPYTTVEIIGKNQNNATVVRGMGVRGNDGSILTSAHVVRDDTVKSIIEGETYMVVKLDTTRDRAILSQRVVSGGYIVDIWELKRPSVGDTIYTEVTRSKKLVTLTGKVLSSSGSVTGYDTLGRVTYLSGIVLTDLQLLPGDSGAPIFSSSREIIDVVHVQ